MTAAGSLQAHLDGVLILDETISGYGYWKVKAVFPPCEEPIVECEDYVPPKIDESNFEILGENKDWSWTDANGDLQTTNTGEACRYNMKFNCDSLRFGVTYPMTSGIGKYSSSLLDYQFADDIDVTACLENNNWYFSVNNLRIPIFTSFCSQVLDFCNNTNTNDKWIDLVDGKNLNQRVNNCQDLAAVIKALKWWWGGPYTNSAKKVFIPSKYYFSDGIVAHENEHVNQNKNTIIKQFNTNQQYIPNLFTNSLVLGNSNYPCPENAVEKMLKPIKNILRSTVKVLQAWIMIRIKVLVCLKMRLMQIKLQD